MYSNTVLSILSCSPRTEFTVFVSCKCIKLKSQLSWATINLESGSDGTDISENCQLAAGSAEDFCFSVLI